MVDYTHPDLEANTWINEAELNGVEGYDDDGNGYIDDIRGWDFINLDNAPLMITCMEHMLQELQGLLEIMELVLQGLHGM